MKYFKLNLSIASISLLAFTVSTYASSFAPQGEGDPEPECVCPATDEKSGPSSNGIYPSVEPGCSPSCTFEIIGVVLKINEGKPGECYKSASSCTRDAVACSWDYRLSITVSQDPNKTQVDYMKHRGATITVGGQTGILHDRLATRECEELVDMKVKGYDSSDNLLFVLDLEDLVCSNCDEAS